VPSTFPQSEEAGAHSYAFFVQSDAPIPEDARFTSGPSVDGKGEFIAVRARPLGRRPEIAPARDETFDAVMVDGDVARR
jgi:Mn-containing catalase